MIRVIGQQSKEMWEGITFIRSGNTKNKITYKLSINFTQSHKPK